MTRAGPRAAFPYPIEETVLDNGLRVAVIPLDTPGLMAHVVAVRVGSRNEIEPGRTGFAHFFEHMMFRGTPRHPPAAYNAALERWGADGNAFTTDDWTCYHVVAASDALPAIMDLESDRFLNLAYGVEAFQKEADAVLGEYNKNASIPFNALFEKLHDTAYVAHTYKHTTMGFLADIERMPQLYDYSLAFFARWYRADNAVLVVAGDVDPGRVLEMARRFYGPWAGGVAAFTAPAEPEQRTPRTAHVPWPTPTLPLLALAYHVPPFDADRVEGRALDVAAQAYFAPTSPLHRTLLLERQWVDWISGGAEDRRDPGLFLILARVKEAARMDDVRRAIESALEEAGTRPLGEPRLESVVSRLRYGFLSGLVTPEDVATTACHYAQLTGELSSIDRSLATLAAVTAEDVRAAAARYLTPARASIVTLAPSTAAVS